MVEVGELNEILARLDGLAKDLAELKELVRKVEPAQYTAEEAFERVLDDLKRRIPLEWLKYVDIPLEAFERLFVPYLVYDEDIRRTVKHLVKQGHIRVRMSEWDDFYGKKQKIKTVYISKRFLEEKPGLGTMSTIVHDFYVAYRRIFKKHLTKGSILTYEEYKKVIGWIFKFRMWWYLKPYIERKILVREKDLLEWAEELDDFTLGNLLVDSGVAEWIETEEEDAVLKILADESEALKRISSQPKGGA